MFKHVGIDLVRKLNFLQAQEMDSFFTPCFYVSLPIWLPRKSMSYLAKGKYHLSTELYEIVSENATVRSKPK